MNKLIIAFFLILLAACKKENQALNSSYTYTYPLKGNQEITLFKALNGFHFLAYKTESSCKAMVLDDNFGLQTQLQYFPSGLKIKDIIEASNGDYYLSLEDGKTGYVYRLDHQFNFKDSIHVIFAPHNWPGTEITETGNLFEVSKGKFALVAQRYHQASSWLNCPTLFYFDQNLENFYWGNPDWQTLAHPLITGTRSVFKPIDGSVLSCGFRGSTIGYSLANFSRTDSNGRIVRDYFTYGKSNQFDKAIDIASISENTNIVLVQTTSFALQGNSDLQLYVINNDLDTLKSAVLPLANDEKPSRILPLKQGGFFVTGITNSLESGVYVTFLMKVNANLRMDWVKSLGSEASGSAPIIIEKGAGEFMIAYCKNSYGNGWNQQDIVISKLNENGDFIK